MKKILGIGPEINSDCFIAETASIIGDVKIDKGSSVWYGTVIRGDFAKIEIGKNTNMQDNSTLHTDVGYPLIIGNDVTIGHNTIIHGCKLGNNILIGMGAIVMNGAEIGDNSIIGANALITEHTLIPPNSLVLGSPGKVVREVTEEEIENIKGNAKLYINLWREKYVF